ncbi:hypothetical protein D3C77_272730 [compost metagenome]
MRDDLRIFLIERIRVDRMLGKRLQGQLRNELGRGLRHNYANLGTLLYELTAERRCLECSDAAGDP